MIRKVTIYSLIALASLLASVSCSREAEVALSGTGVRGIAAPFEIDGSLQGALPLERTRTDLVYDASSGLLFYWSEEDRVAVFGSAGRSQQLPLFIDEVTGERVKVAEFQVSEDYGLKAGTEYLAYCPVLNPSIYLKSDEVPFDYTGQVQQDGRMESTSHLGAYDYMVSAPTVPLANNMASFYFTHRCTPLAVMITNLPAGAYGSVTLKTDSEVFALKGTMDIFEGTISPDTLGDSVTLTYSSPVSVTAGGSLNAWIMLSPVDLRGKKAELVLGMSSGKTLKLSVDPESLRDYKAGKAYRLQVDASKSSPEGALPGKFTVDAKGTKVNFASGNLQHCASSGEWRTAENQYDYIGGSSSGGNLYGNVSGNTNTPSNPSLYTGWSDLFSWSADLPENLGSGWFMLSKEQWEYVIKERTTTSGARYFMGNLVLSDKGLKVFGVFLFPDDWKGTFFPVSPAIGELNNAYNNSNRNYTYSKPWQTTVTMTSSQFADMEKNDGVVFLPETGRLSGNALGDFTYSSEEGSPATHASLRYWSSTEYSNNNRCYALSSYDGLLLKVVVYNDGQSTPGSTMKTYGMGVRCATIAL